MANVRRKFKAACPVRDRRQHIKNAGIRLLLLLTWMMPTRVGDRIVPGRNTPKEQSIVN